MKRVTHAHLPDSQYRFRPPPPPPREGIVPGHLKHSKARPAELMLTGG